VKKNIDDKGVKKIITGNIEELKTLPDAMGENDAFNIQGSLKLKNKLQ